MQQQNRAKRHAELRLHYQQKEHRHAELRHELKVRKAEVEAAGGTWGKPALSAEPWKSKYAEYTRLKEELGYGEEAAPPPAAALYSPYGDEEFVPAPVRASESDARLASGETGGGLFEALSGHLGVAVAEAAGGAGPGLSEEEKLELQEFWRQEQMELARQNALHDPTSTTEGAEAPRSPPKFRPPGYFWA